MIKQFKIIGLLLLAASFSGSAFAASNAECQATIKQFRELGDTSKFISEAYGMAVLPTIGKAGIGLGGAYGEGCVYANGAHKGSVNMGQVTIGFQLGAQAYSPLILFKDKAAYDAFTSGGFEFGADATAVALTYGASAGAGTSGTSASAGGKKGVARWVGEMVVFTLAKGGLMYEASIGGQKYDYTPN